MAAAMGFPMGMRFRPTDVEKMNFLLCKVSGLALPCGDLMIGTADLYGEKEPWDILEDSEEEEECFFTTLKKIGKNNKRYSRNVGNGGTWTNKGQRAPIYGGKQLMGYKRCFRYENKKQVDHDNVGTWLLKEYTLPDHSRVKQEYKDYALCVLKRKGGSSKTTPSPSPSPPRVEPQEEESMMSIGFDNNYYTSLLLGSEQSTIPMAGQEEESNHCGLREFAEQFLREERQSTNHLSSRYHNLQQFDDSYY